MNTPVDGKLFDKLQKQSTGPTSLEERLVSEREADGRHKRGLRDYVASKIFYVLWAQLGLMALLLLLQGFGLWEFKLNDWAFGFLVNGSLVQTFFIIRYIVSDLFSGASINSDPPS